VAYALLIPASNSESLEAIANWSELAQKKKKKKRQSAIHGHNAINHRLFIAAHFSPAGHCKTRRQTNNK